MKDLRVSLFWLSVMSYSIYTLSSDSNPSSKSWSEILEESRPLLWPECYDFYKKELESVQVSLTGSDLNEEQIKRLRHLELSYINCIQHSKDMKKMFENEYLKIKK